MFRKLSIAFLKSLTIVAILVTFVIYYLLTIKEKSNKIYCPEYCCLVPREINSLLTGQRVPKNHYRGVKRDYHNNLHPYTAYVYGGTFFTPWEAYLYYKQNKEAHIKEVAIKYYEKGQITEECFQGLINYEVDP